MPTRTNSQPRVAVLADSDTRWKWGALTAHRVAPDHRLDGYLLRGRATPTARQLSEVGVHADAMREVTGIEFIHAIEREHYDAVVLSCVGGGVQAVLHGIGHALRNAPHRPVLITGYVGVVYEKLADGLLLRNGADIVLANSRYDAERFREVYRGVGADPDVVVECALPFLGGDSYDETARTRRPYTGGTVVFAVQPSVPDNRADRAYLLRRAVEHARKHADREVLVKLRSKPGEHTTHIEELPYQKLAEKHAGALPSNFRLVYGHMGEVLDGADLLVTVSSTAALESLHRGIPTAVLTDLGVREVLGNHHFIGSGCLASWDQLDTGYRPTADPQWVARQGVAAADGAYEHAFDAVRERLTDLITGPPLPPVTPYYTAVTAPGYLPRILNRYGFQPDGSPRPGVTVEPEDASGLKRVVRNTMREAARGAYRHGVQRVAPVIRRMGEL
ncbi:DUF6716 putative glycosyltransferase [Streptomyces sp. 796.1]|uniref:DUF6716 putative glycosyltransferase n=1 Tax=Streptomyces sp. 796.1 TaxID=3163029 RepID=UPI0039C95A34